MTFTEEQYGQMRLEGKALSIVRDRVCQTELCTEKKANGSRHCQICSIRNKTNEKAQ